MQPVLGTFQSHAALMRRQLSRSIAPPDHPASRRWRLTRRLSIDSRFAVFRASATNEAGPGCYVLKTTGSLAANDAIAHAMLQREYVVSCEVNHPNLNSVLVADISAEEPALILPYLEGVSLRRLIASRAATPHLLSVAHALMLIRQLAEALATMHNAGWLHGQVWPEHIIVSPHSHTTLIDLTLARRLNSHECDGGDVLNTADYHRTATYAAPESFSSRRRLTAAADTYSLGIVLFELLSGHPPFAANSLRQLAAYHQRHAPPDLRPLHPCLSHEPAELVRRMLAKEPLRRPDDEQLIRWIAELEIQELA